MRGTRSWRKFWRGLGIPLNLRVTELAPWCGAAPRVVTTIPATVVDRIDASASPMGVTIEIGYHATDGSDVLRLGFRILVRWCDSSQRHATVAACNACSPLYSR